MFVSGESTMALSDCHFTQCEAQGGASGFTDPFDPFGGFADGGGLDVDYLSTVVVSNTTFTHDQAIGGAGGAGTSGSPGVAGAFAQGGGMNVDGGSSATVNGCSFAHDVALGGAGGAGAAGADGGAGGLAKAVACPTPRIPPPA